MASPTSDATTPSRSARPEPRLEARGGGREPAPPRRISLCLVLHNHQPIGNFDWVVARAFERAYEPMVAALERHPRIRLGLHYSGPLFEWLDRARPAFGQRLAALLARDQVELLGGGWYEPVLALLPEADRQAQLERTADELERRFGRRPQGAWLTERVWESSVPANLGRAGYAWTILDDEHLRTALAPPDLVWESAVSDDQGWPITLLATSRALRYGLPFGEVERMLDLLRDLATLDGRRVAVMGDDGEKFGSWPTTFEHCWGSGAWVEHWFAAIEASEAWLGTVRPSDWLATHPPAARVYPPNGSYLEMAEWSLPPAEARSYRAALASAEAEGRPEARFLRGGTWRGFQIRYREANDLKAQMLHASRAVAAMAPGPEREAAREHLYRGQSNDCYWHGLFGGIYLVHLRLAALAELIAAEDLAAGGPAAPAEAGLIDWDLDGVLEAVLGDAAQSCVVDLAEGAGLTRWDLRAARAALLAVMRRRPEAYHDILREAEADAAEADAAEADAAEAEPRPDPDAAEADAADAETRPDPAADAVHTIHAPGLALEPGLVAAIHEDGHERRGGLVRFLAPGTSAADLAAAREDELGDFVTEPFESIRLRPGELVARRDGSVRLPDGPSRAVRVTKRLLVGGNRAQPELRLAVTVVDLDRRPLACDLAVEWGFDLAGGGHNPAAWYDLPAGPPAHSPDDLPVHAAHGESEAGGGGPVRRPHDSSGELREARGLAFGNDDLGLRIEATVRPAATLLWYPIETVNDSDAGFERVYQGSSLLQRWPLRLAPGEKASFEIRYRAVTSAASDDPRC